MTRQDFRFLHRLRVRWAEVDMQKIVFNPQYLMYFDTAIADYWRALALPYEASMKRLEGDLFVKKATIEFHASAQFDDLLEVGLRCTRIGTSSMVFKGAIFRADQLLINGELIYVFADPVGQTSKPVPPALRQLLTDFESGETIAQIRLGSWQELGPDAAKVRTEVFVNEQRIPREEEWDEGDPVALHAVTYNGLGQPVATGRMLPEGKGVARIGRMSVLRVLRGSRLGTNVLELLVDAARRRGDKEVVLHAQRSAEGFYVRAGFEPRGEPFSEVGIPHIEMVRALKR
ncbi:MAG: YbgC/FadM family acyl-CoA thioesterase [Burkholderiales bacterium]